MDSKELVIYINDSNVIKPDSYKFESLGIVHDVLQALH